MRLAKMFGGVATLAVSTLVLGQVAGAAQSYSSTTLPAQVVQVGVDTALHQFDVLAGTGSSATIYEYDEASGALIRSFPEPGAVDIAVDSAMPQVAVASASSVTMINETSGQTIWSTPVTSPHRVALDDTNSLVWMLQTPPSGSGNPTLQSLNEGTGALATQYPLNSGGLPLTLAVDGAAKRIYVSWSEAGEVINETTGAETDQIENQLIDNTVADPLNGCAYSGQNRSGVAAYGCTSKALTAPSQYGVSGVALLAGGGQLTASEEFEGGSPSPTFTPIVTFDTATGATVSSLTLPVAGVKVLASDQMSGQVFAAAGNQLYVIGDNPLPALPETSHVYLLGVAALAVGAGAFGLRRRRRSRTA